MTPLASSMLLTCAAGLVSFAVLVPAADVVADSDAEDREDSQSGHHDEEVSFSGGLSLSSDMAVIDDLCSLSKPSNK